AEAQQTYKPDFLTIEIGGTVGDMEALPFIEAARQYRLEHKHSTINVHVVKMDYLYPSDEGKTKPIQHAVTSLRAHGIQPDVLIVRCKRPLAEDENEKICPYTGIPDSRIVQALDANSQYDVPAQVANEGIESAILSAFGLKE